MRCVRYHRFDVLPGLKARGFLPCRSCGTPEGSCFTGSRRGKPWSYARLRRRLSLSLRPRARMFLAAFTSRSCTVPHAAQVQARTLQRLRAVLDPAGRAHLRGRLQPAGPGERPPVPARPCTPASRTNADQPASCTDLASRVRPSPDTHRSSTYTAWLSRMMRVESLCSQSRRVSATRACTRATLIRALARLLLPWPCGTGPAAPCGACAQRGAGTSGWRPSARRTGPRSGSARGRSRPRRPPRAAGPGPACDDELAKYRPGRVHDHGDR